MNPSSPIPEPICSICSGQARPRYLWQGFQVYRCSACGLESVLPTPSETQLKAYYETVFYQAHDDKKAYRWESKLRLVEHAFAHYLDKYRRYTGGSSPKAFVDVGGGLGFYVRAAINRGISSCLMDYGPTALEFARSTLGVNRCIQGDVEKCADHIEHNAFDFGLARHVVEHMRDPVGFVDNLRQILRLGGLVQIETPNASTWEQFAHPRQIANHFSILRKSNPGMSFSRALLLAASKSMSGVNPPKHLWGFTESSLSRLLIDAGLEIQEVVRPVFGSRIYDPLYYEIHRLRDRAGLGIPYYFFERLASMLAFGNGANLVVLARKT